MSDPFHYVSRVDRDRERAVIDALSKSPRGLGFNDLAHDVQVRMAPMTLRKTLNSLVDQGAVVWEKQGQGNKSIIRAVRDVSPKLSKFYRSVGDLIAFCDEYFRLCSIQVSKGSPGIDTSKELQERFPSENALPGPMSLKQKWARWYVGHVSDLFDFLTRTQIIPLSVDHPKASNSVYSHLFAAHKEVFTNAQQLLEGVRIGRVWEAESLHSSRILNNTKNVIDRMKYVTSENKKIALSLLSQLEADLSAS